jgi:hypothetical protein
VKLMDEPPKHEKFIPTSRAQKINRRRVSMMDTYSIASNFLRIQPSLCTARVCGCACGVGRQAESRALVIKQNIRLM